MATEQAQALDLVQEAIPRLHAIRQLTNDIELSEHDRLVTLRPLLSALWVQLCDVERALTPDTPENGDIEMSDIDTKYHCADYLHSGQSTPAAWFVRAARHVSKTDSSEPYAVVPDSNGAAAAVCDEHLADGIRRCAEYGGPVIVRRENVEHVDVAASAL